MNNSKRNKLSLFIAILFFSCFNLYGESKDFAGWSNIKLVKSINNTQIYSNIGFRVKNDFKKKDRLHLNVGMIYNVIPNLRLDGGYEFHYKYSDNNNYVRNRYYLSFLIPVNISNLKLTYRERFQQTFYNNDNSMDLRSKLKASYKLKKSPISPFFSIELYQPIGDEKFFSIKRILYKPGITLFFNKSYYLDLYYCRQFEKTLKTDIVGINCSFTM